MKISQTITCLKAIPLCLGKNFVEKSIFEIERDFGDKFTEFLYEPF